MEPPKLRGQAANRPIAFRNGAPPSSTDPCVRAATKPEPDKTVPAPAARGRGVHAGSGVGFWSGAGDCLVRRSDRKRVWRGEPGNPRRGRSRSGFGQGLAPLFPGRSASRPPPGIFLLAVVGSPAACMMPGSIRSPSVHLISVLERDSAVRQRGNGRHHRRPRPGRDDRGRAASQEAGPAPSLFVKGCGSGEAMLMPDRTTSPARG